MISSLMVELRNCELSEYCENLHRTLQNSFFEIRILRKITFDFFKSLFLNLISDDMIITKILPESVEVFNFT